MQNQSNHNSKVLKSNIAINNISYNFITPNLLNSEELRIFQFHHDLISLENFSKSVENKFIINFHKLVDKAFEMFEAKWGFRNLNSHETKQICIPPSFCK